MAFPPHQDDEQAPPLDSALADVLEGYRRFVAHTFTATLNLADAAQRATDHHTREVLQRSIAELDESGRLLREALLPLLEPGHAGAN